jgi:diacylglycerol O-acyltransferase / wax synthase
MKQLSGLDASFLHMETPEMPMHVGALHLFELPADYKGSFVNDLRKHIAARLPLVPALRRKLEKMPLNLTNPMWVDAPPDLKQHIVRIKLPKGSTLVDLEARVGQLHPVLLDRDRPLWKFHVFEGLAPGPHKEKRYGLYTQLHHAAVDGQAAVALASAILDVGPVPRDVKVEPRPGKKLGLGLADMLGGMLVNQLQQYANLVKALPSTVAALSSAAKQGAGGVAGKVIASVRGQARPAATVGQLGLAPRTRFNASVTAGRTFAAVSLPMSELKALRRAHDATLNDVVLMLCSSALRRYFLQHGPLPRKSLVAAVPVSLRAAGDTAANNQASMTVVKLGTHIADPIKRLRYVKAATAAMKSTLGSVKSLMPTDFPSLGVPWLMSTAASLYGRAKVADRIPPIANVVISNVPGPAFPLYMAGARMLTNYPTSIVVHGVGLNITVQSYNESLDVGLIACAAAAPHLADLATHMTAALNELTLLPPTASVLPAPTLGKLAAVAAPAKKRLKLGPEPTSSAPRTKAGAPVRQRVKR